MKLKKEHVVWGFLGLLALVYLVNPTLGVFEFIPDNVPLVGNLDEVGATLLLLKSLIELGIVKVKGRGCRT